MPSVARVPPVHRPPYSKAELFEHRRNILRSARSFPPGSKSSSASCSVVSRPFKNKDWLGANTVEGSGGLSFIQAE
jgi:hypothetical protein